VTDRELSVADLVVRPVAAIERANDQAARRAAASRPDAGAGAVTFAELLADPGSAVRAANDGRP
jgi:hypothetical protein